MSLIIRQATAVDAGTVLEFTRALARYEGTLDEVVATETGMLATLFSGEPHAYCEIAEWQGTPAGFAVWSYNYSIFLGKNCLLLEDLFIDERFRRRGIGKALLLHLAEKCRELKLGRMEWSVLDWNEPATELYRNLGAAISGGRNKCRWTADDIARIGAHDATLPNSPGSRQAALAGG